MSQVFRGALGCVMVIVAIGCGKGGGDAAGSGSGGSDKKTITDLKMLGANYITYVDGNSAGPSRIEDLRDLLGPDERLLNRVKSGELVLIWDVKLTNLKSDEGLVLGYVKDVPENGGAVLMGDASVVQMTAEQFKKAKKATPTPKKE
jgi:hypothetical protein